MEHERLLDEIRRLNLRLCKISPPISPKSNLRPIENKNNNLELETQRESVSYFCSCKNEKNQIS